MPAGLVIMVLKNNDLNQVTWEQRAMSGDPRYADSQALPDFSYAAYAELIGLKGIHVDKSRRRRRAAGSRHWRPIALACWKW